MHLLKRIALGFVLGSLFVTMAAPVYAQTIMERIKKSEPIRYAIGNDAPMGYIGENGKPMGIEVELMQMIFKRMGITDFQQKVTTFGSLIPGIQARRFDIASDGIYIRPSRCAVVLFSEPDMMLGMGAFVRDTSSIKATTVEELARNKSLRFGKMAGGLESDEIVAAGGSANKVASFTTRPSLIAAVKTGRIDVGLITLTGAISVVSHNPGLRLLALTPPVVNGKTFTFYTGFAFNKDDGSFVRKFSNAMESIIHSPVYPKLLAKYHVPESVIPPEDVSVTKICGSE